MKLHKLIIKRRLLVIIVWAVVFLASTPALMGYSHFISYSNSSAANSHAESQIASNILANSSKQNSTLFLVVQENPYNTTGIANSTLEFQNALGNSTISNYSSSDSPYSAYIAFLNSALSGYSNSLVTSYYELNQSAFQIYSFPSAFLTNWSLLAYNSSLVMEAAANAQFNSTNSYQSAFLSGLNSSIASIPSNTTVTNAPEIVNTSISGAINEITGNPLMIYAAQEYLGIYNYTTNVKEALSMFVSQTFNFSLTTDMLNATLVGGNIGLNYVHLYGLKGIPAFISDRYISKDNSTFIVNVVFSVPSGYVGSGGSTPSSTATPQIQKISSAYFGTQAKLTGDGAIQYETQQITAQYGFVFGLLFVVLAVAVAITLVSWKGGLISLIFVSLATLLGYLSIYLTGLIVQNVSYIVNYTLTAVAVGVSTDYLVFIASRYRQEIREGKSHDEAMEAATRKAGKAVVISGITVGFSLATFSVIPGFESWGLVLLFAILMIIALETTLFPAILSYIGPKFFTRKGRGLEEEGYHRKSAFYKAAKVSMKRKWAVAGIIILLGAPAGYFFFAAPTTYNFNTGLPQNLDSVQALNILDQKFGSNVLYPITVIKEVNGTGGVIPGGELAAINATTNMLLGTSGVTKVIGPYSNGSAYTSSINASSYILDNGKYVYYLVYTSYSPYSQNAINVVSNLRENSSLVVGGITSGIIDQQHENTLHYTELEILIIAVIFIVLLVSFMSPKYPLISISGVFISISWTTFILYLISGTILGEGLIYLIPIILFIILMSLGNDYTVFIISRVKEYSSQEGFEEGLPKAMASSGRVVTSLGMILALSLGSLGLIRSGFLQQLGIAFFISLIIDTFIIRTFYFPAMLSILRKKEKGKISSQ